MVADSAPELESLSLIEVSLDELSADDEDSGTFGRSPPLSSSVASPPLSLLPLSSSLLLVASQTAVLFFFFLLKRWPLGWPPLVDLTLVDDCDSDSTSRLGVEALPVLDVEGVTAQRSIS